MENLKKHNLPDVSELSVEHNAEEMLTAFIERFPDSPIIEYSDYPSCDCGKLMDYHEITGARMGVFYCDDCYTYKAHNVHNTSCDGGAKGHKGFFVSLSHGRLRKCCNDCGNVFDSFLSKKNTPIEDVTTYQDYLEAVKKYVSDEFYAFFKELRERKVQESKDAENDWWEWYNKYLLTDKWKEIRAKALERDNYTCQGCRRARAEQVHHLTYDNVGDELLFQLISLCANCHEKAHKK